MKVRDVFWFLILITATLTMSLILPLHFVFNSNKNKSVILILRIVDVIFVLDLIISFLKYHFKQNEFIFEQGTGLKKYLTSWFPVDLVAIIPLIFLSSTSLFIFLRFLKLSKLIYLMRLYKNREIKLSNVLLFLYFSFWFIQIAHWLACGWIYFRGIHEEISYVENYIKALYWTITTITTIGYGDIVPATISQTIYVMCVEIIGVALYGFVIGNFASILSKKDPAKMNYQNNLENLSSLIQLRKIPNELQSKIRDYYTYIYYQKFGYDEVNFIKQLPKSISEEVSYFIKKDLISIIPIFRNAPDEFIKEISVHLRPLVIIPNSFVFKEGELATEMYFVVSGSLSVLFDKEQKEIAKLKDGDFFGEIAIFENIRRTASVKANTYCDLYVLTKEKYEEVARKYPSIANEIQKEAKIRKEKL